MSERITHGRDGVVTVTEVCEQCGDARSGCCINLKRRLPGKDPRFLRWLADRLVNVYGENANIDFVLKLRRMAGEE